MASKIDLTRSAGVADYFASLGVGETLVWKHTQKMNEQQIDNTDEDEAALLERFYREIVSVTLVCNSSEEPEHHGESSATTSNKVLSPAPSELMDGQGGLNTIYWTCPASTREGQDGMWTKSQVFEANLNPVHGLRAEFATTTNEQTASDNTPLKGLKQKFRNQIIVPMMKRRTKVTSFYLGFQRRGPDEVDQPAIADLSLRYVRIHKTTVVPTKGADEERPTTKRSTSLAKNVARVAEVGKQTLMESYRSASSPTPQERQSTTTTFIAHLEEMIELPEGFDEWCIPEEYKVLRFGKHNKNLHHAARLKSTILFPHDNTSQSSEGVEAVEAYVDTNGLPRSPPNSPQGRRSWTSSNLGEDDNTEHTPASPVGPQREKYGVPHDIDADVYFPKLLPELLPSVQVMREDEDYLFVPVLAIRRQRVGDEERFHEDPAVVEIAITFRDGEGEAVLPNPSDDDDFEAEEDDGAFSIVGKSQWREVADGGAKFAQAIGTAAILVKRNVPAGFADAAFAARVLDRFPKKNYKELPLPEEELPMFCYPTGCRLHRARYSDAPLPQYYGFVVKNERGDSIHVSCVSFMEPLTSTKTEQLKRMSEYRQRASIPNRRYCERRGRLRTPLMSNSQENTTGSFVSDLRSGSDAVDNTLSEIAQFDRDDSFYLTAFDDMTTFENKTICLISRYPFWTAFRRFLSNLHLISGSPSELPLERFISHLLLTVPVPRAGGPPVLVPLPALNGSMVLEMPPTKDFPLVDLPFERIFACLDVPTVVTVVLGFLALERKILIMSSRPSLVLDACELLRSLLFPFDLCAPYVPRLTEPFMSCLEFPGAIFAGIHDDGTDDGLAAIVRNNPPEDSTIVDLDSGEIECSGDRYEVLKQCWGIIPSGPRSMLVSEIETLCRDAGIVPGQEPLDSQIDPAFAASIPPAFIDGLDTPAHGVREPLDDRAVRDAFLRFFCAVLGGYERYLVVPDADFLISGNEWFDAQGYLASAPQDRAPYLGSLVTTQLFQSFIQRRTEASDVHCLLFDECLIEYHSSPVPYGRLGGDVENVAAEGDPPQMLYSLLVDQCCAESFSSFVGESTIASSMIDDRGDDEESDAALNLSPTRSGPKSILSTDSSLISGAKPGSDIVTAPSRKGLPENVRFVYFVDGNPCFPHQLDPELFFPMEPSNSMLSEISETPLPLLARTERELDESYRRRKSALSKRGLQNQRRCLWQFPKLMGSHFLGAWMMCIPSQVSQANLSQDQQSKYLLRAFGALRLLRNKQRLIPDEATYRSLMVACGRIASDRRIELVKLFGLLRIDGIFPSAVTLGQYTRALAEGYSKRSSGMGEDDNVGPGSVEVTVTGSSENGIAITPRNVEREGVLTSFDENLSTLEDSGRRWRQRYSSQHRDATGLQNDGVPLSTSDDHKKNAGKSWIPVVMSSSFLPTGQSDHRKSEESKLEDMEFVALWSRTRACNSCSYIPLDEEVQCGWDVVGSDNEIDGAIECPRCGSLLTPMIGFSQLTLREALDPSSHGVQHDDAIRLPPQLESSVPRLDRSDEPNRTGSVMYLSPESLRSALERYLEVEGESALARDTMRERNPEIFYNLWWYSARFSLPLPLPILPGANPETGEARHRHACAFASWDKSVALRGCQQGARALLPHLPPQNDYPDSTIERTGSFGGGSALSRFDMQSFSQADWDHEDLSKILVFLVDASDKRDFKPVIECILRCNKRRTPEQGPVDDSMVEGTLSDISSGTASDELDCYRTILYLAKYQCTTVFHNFFPATAKACKGYHFWCATGTPLPVFDHLFRDASKRVRGSDGAVTPIHDVSDVALGFRCVFGHII